MFFSVRQERRGILYLRWMFVEQSVYQLIQAQDVQRAADQGCLDANNSVAWVKGVG